MTPTEKIEAIYATLPKVACQRKCQMACGPIKMSRVEADRIEAHVNATRLPIAMDTGGELCPLLPIMGSCMIYEIRPLVCRLYGVIAALRCPHDCIPERWVDGPEARGLMRALEVLGEPGSFWLPVDGAPVVDTTPEQAAQVLSDMFRQGLEAQNVARN